ncbi:MAG TPA: TolC family protein, partial [Gemmatimonadaceae bacterium]
MYTHALAGAFLLLYGASAGAQQFGSELSQRIGIDTAATPMLSRQQAVEQALAHNPQLGAVREQIAQARDRVTEATALPDAEFGASIEDESGVLRPGNAGTKNIGLGLTIPFPTKLYLRGKVAGTDVDAVRFSYAQARQAIASQTVQAYDALLVVQRHGDNLREAKQLADDFLQKTQARFNAGTTARLDVIKARVEVAQAENDLIANERDVANARAALNRLLGRTLGATVEANDSLAVPAALPALEPLEQRALAGRPEVRSLVAERAGAKAATSLAGEY